MAVSEEVEKVVADFISEPRLKNKTEGMGKGLLLAATLADESNQLTKDIQNQFDQLVVEGDSSVEAAQARIDGNGKAYTTLKKRLDGKEQEVTASLSEKASLRKVESFTTEVNSELDSYLIELNSLRSIVAVGYSSQIKASITTGLAE